jgi:hypothetical protein
MQRQLAPARRCAVLGWAEGERPVWASRNAVFFQCPESLMTGEVWHWLNQAAVWKNCAVNELLDLPAIDVDAMQLIWEEEKKVNEYR